MLCPLLCPTPLHILVIFCACLWPSNLSCSLRVLFAWMCAAGGNRRLLAGGSDGGATVAAGVRGHLRARRKPQEGKPFFACVLCRQIHGGSSTWECQVRAHATDLCCRQREDRGGPGPALAQGSHARSGLDRKHTVVPSFRADQV